MSQDRNPWHSHPSTHLVGGNLGKPDPPKLTMPGSLYRKGTSGNPAASDHSHPLDIGMRIYTAAVQNATFSIGGTAWSAWGSPTFSFAHVVRDETCDLVFHYETSFYAVQGAVGIQYGIWYAGVTNFDDRIRHFKNNALDHTLAAGTIVLAARKDESNNVVNTAGAALGSQTFYFMWRLYYGVGTAWASADSNDFAQITLTESYVAP